MLPAILGGFIGFLALRLNEIGWAFSAVVLALMAAYYVYRQRQASLGWMLLGAGIVPGLIVGRNVITDLIDPAVQVSSDTWIFLMVSVSVAVAGGLVVYASDWWPSGTRAAR